MEPRSFLMSGKAHREKVVQWGPYVMNSQTEIMEALRDFQMGKLGFLTPFDENPDKLREILNNIDICVN